MRIFNIIVTWVILVLVIIIPVVFIGFSAFKDGIHGFILGLIRPEAIHAFEMSAIIVVIVTLINVIVGVLVSLEIARGKWLGRWVKPIINAIIDLPFAVSPVIGGLMIILLLGPNTVMGAFFESIGFKIVFALPGMILATSFVTFPFVIRELVPVLSKIGREAEEASSILGASPLKTFFEITWPSIRWAVLYGTILTIARALGEFGAVLVVSGNVINQTQTATTLVYQDAENFQLTSANSIALVLGAICVISLIVIEKIKAKKEGVFHEHSR